MIHYRNLQQCLQKGLKLRRIHRILNFKQKEWMKPYIDLNTTKRKEAVNDADRNLFKLLNNAVYGKTMENLRKRIKIRIVKNEKDIIKHISKPSYLSLKIFTNLTLNKPIYVGITVLEASKLAMYSFHYDFMKNIFNDFKLLFTDTDSLCYEMCDEILMKIFMSIRNILI